MAAIARSHRKMPDEISGARGRSHKRRAAGTVSTANPKTTRSAIKSLIEQADQYVASKEWAFVGHLLTQAAVECMTLAEKAQDGGPRSIPTRYRRVFVAVSAALGWLRCDLARSQSPLSRLKIPEATGSRVPVPS